MINIEERLAKELGLKLGVVNNVVEMLDEGNTVPFIARYRKEKTGGLSDEVLRKFSERLTYLRSLDERKADVSRLIEEQGKLTQEITEALGKAETLTEVEDIYRPYKPKKRTRATIAKAKGLEPLANLILEGAFKGDVLQEASKYIDEEKGVEKAEDAVSGALDIIAEGISEEAKYRKFIRELVMREGLIESKGSSEETTPYEMYYDYSEEVRKIPPHRILAINRGEKEKILSVKITIGEDKIISYLEREILKGNEVLDEQLKLAIRDAYKRLIFPSIEREIRNELTDKGEEGAILIFKENLKALLMQAPIKGKTVMGYDPGFRTGCKIAILDSTGKFLENVAVYPTVPKRDIVGTKKTLKELIYKYDVDVISLGNGTASRESEEVIAEIISEIKKESGKEVAYVIVSEAGASVYSASELATKEYPDLDVTVRGAISIGRRLQDPMAELVKIDPKAIGVGQYQHDVTQKRLEESLKGVVEDSVNKVGVDLNTASASLLEYISGISKAIAKNIVAYREENGQFTDRKELLKVAKLGPKAFEQCAGFMRISGGKNPLDATSVHPESYEAASALLSKLGYKPNDVVAGNLLGLSLQVKDYKKMAAELGIGEITLRDIVKELEKPARDPRDDMPKPILRSDVLEMKDLKEGMVLKGTVRNVIDFGAFVDIGVHQDGLVHISEMTERFIKHPLEAVSVGDIVDVRVIGVDMKKKRISLSMKGLNK